MRCAQIFILKMENRVGVEYNYVNIETKKMITLGKGSLWSDLFYDFIELQEPYSIDEYFGIITTKYKWSNDDGWVTVISTMIHSFLSTHPFKNYACIADDIVIFADKSCDVIDKYDELMRINSYSDYKNHRIWSRYTSDECAQPSTIWQPIKMFNWDEYLESHGLRGLAPQEQADLFNCKFEAKDL